MPVVQRPGPRESERDLFILLFLTKRMKRGPLGESSLNSEDFLTYSATVKTIVFFFLFGLQAEEALSEYHRP